MTSFKLLLTTALLSLPTLSYAMEEESKQEQALNRISATLEVWEKNTDKDKEDPRHTLLRDFNKINMHNLPDNLSDKKQTALQKQHETLRKKLWKNPMDMLANEMVEKIVSFVHNPANPDLKSLGALNATNKELHDLTQDAMEMEKKEYEINQQAQEIVQNIRPDRNNFVPYMACTQSLKNKSVAICNRVLKLLLQSGKLKDQNFLHLNNTNVSDLSPLTSRIDFHSLYITGCPQITKDHVETLSQILPNCTIFSDFGPYQGGVKAVVSFIG